MRKYTDEFIAQILADYPHTNTAEMAVKYGINVNKISSIALNRGVRKSAEFMKEMLDRTSKNLHDSGMSHRFKKGHSVWNKGQYMRMHPPTEFKKGQKPHNYKPVGSERITKDGYLERKVAEPRKWRGIHLLVWEEVNGPVPPRHKVIFIDNNKMNVSINNLLLITFEEAMRRNTIHRYPKEIKEAIKTISKLKKTIRNHGKEQN
jgi:hypothetical protein